MCYYIKNYNKYTQSSINDSLNDAFIIIAWRGGRDVAPLINHFTRRWNCVRAFYERVVIWRIFDIITANEWICIFCGCLNRLLTAIPRLHGCDNYRAMTLFFDTLHAKNALNLALFQRKEFHLSFVRKLLHPRERENRLNYKSCRSLNPF